MPIRRTDAKRAGATVAGVLVYGTQVSAANAGAFCAAPDTPHAVFPKSAGSYVRWQSQRTPRRCVPPTAASRRRPKGQPLAASPSGLLLAGGGAKNGRGRQLPLLLRRLRLPHADAFGCARGLMLALRSLNARVLRAFLRRFKYTAQSRSHAGCALGGDRLAMSVCGQKPIETVFTFPLTGVCRLTFPETTAYHTASRPRSRHTDTHGRTRTDTVYRRPL